LGLRTQSSPRRSTGLTAPFGLAVLTFVAMPASVGYQDLASTIAQRSSLSERWREHVLKSPFGTIHAATFGFPRPVGATIPEPFGDRLASLDVGASELTGSVFLRTLLDLSQAAPSEEFAAINRTRKGDRITRALADRRKGQAIARVTAPSPPEPKTAPSNPDHAKRASIIPAPSPPEPKAAPANADHAERASIAPSPAPPEPAIDERPIEVTALPPSSERETTERETTPLAAAPPAAAAPPSAWDDAARPLPTDEVFASASMAWIGAAETAAEVSAEPSVISAAPPAISAAPPAAKIVEAALAPEPTPQPTYVVASASADIDLPRPAALKADISIDSPADKSQPPADSRISDTESYRPDTAVPTLGDTMTPTFRTARIYFGVEPLAGLGGGLEAWAPGETSILSGSQNDIALEDEARPAAQVRLAALHPGGGETIVNKGEVPGDGRALLSPADRLGLVGEERQKAEKCLADAVYFESRGEPVRGQIAVAQVVMNRVFSGYYPSTVCGVVYQNAHRRLACQFTFACDGIPDKITEPQAWERAKNIARETLDGKHWLPDVGKATHYHAYWVRPYWVRTMNKLDKIGVHTFYRPRNWGDGAAQPVWGDAELNVAPAEKL
jgi:spore germination cell wall hydrolase CwlJ-like protein